MTTSALVIEYIGGTNYVALTREITDEGRNLRNKETNNTRCFFNNYLRILGSRYRGVIVKSTGGVSYHHKPS